ncbi:MAG: GIY-YIG nuclease family protein [Verrucomicrobiota bacterium]
MTLYRVYVIENHKGKRYIGLSENVEQRLEDHNKGRSRWTRGKGPWGLRWKSIELSLSEARKLENRMKRQKGGRGLMTLMEEYSS